MPIYLHSYDMGFYLYPNTSGSYFIVFAVSTWDINEYKMGHTMNSVYIHLRIHYKGLAS